MPFCKFCKDSGKTQAEFTSHYPKDKPGKDGNVVCPTILNNECRYCHTKGHAKSHCPVLKEKNSRKRMKSVPQHFHRRGPQQTPSNLNGWAMTAMTQHKKSKSLRVQVVKKVASQNAFAALSEDDYDPKKRVDLPKVVEAKAATGCWSVKPDLSKEAIQQKLASKKQELAVEEQLKEDAKMTPLVSVKDMIAATQPFTMNWGDAMMDEDEAENNEIVLDAFDRPDTDNSAW